MRRNCEWCGRFGARKVRLPAKHPQAVDGTLSFEICQACEDRANKQILAEREKERRLLEEVPTPARDPERLAEPARTAGQTEIGT